MALYTNFPAQHKFYGGISPAWGPGNHQDVDPVTGKKEYVIADYLNRLELRVQQMERVVNQLEHEILYPTGYISTSGTVTLEVPASGNWYRRSRLDLIASGLNSLAEQIFVSGVPFSGGSLNYYPFFAGGPF